MRTHSEKVSNIMLFCALMMARNRSATLWQSMKLVPLSGGSKILAERFIIPSSVDYKALATERSC